MATDEEELIEAKRKLKDFELRGVDSLSDYDRKVCYGDDVDAALRNTRRLLEAHVTYYESKLDKKKKSSLDNWID